MELKTRLRLKKDTSSNWTKYNPVLLDGEMIIVVTDSGDIRLKIGDGKKTYTQLPFNDEALSSLYAEKSSLATVATSGQYSDLKNAPTTMKGATSSRDGTSGLVPEPMMGSQDFFLRADGTWSEPTPATMRGATMAVDGKSGLVPAPTAGPNNRFLCCDGGWLNPTPAIMKGATHDEDGASGLVPAPTAGENTLFLSAGGTWEYPELNFSRYYTDSTLSENDKFLARSNDLYKNIKAYDVATEMFRILFSNSMGETRSLLFIRNNRSGSSPQTSFRIGINISTSGAVTSVVTPTIPKGEVRSFIITGNRFCIDGTSAVKDPLLMSRTISYEKTSGYDHYYNIKSIGWIDWSSYSSCLTGDTLVTMADRSQKRLDAICVGDEILSYDWNTMALIPNKVVYTDKDEHKMYDHYDKWTFDDGTVVKTVHRHEFYNVEAGCMKYMDEWSIGDHAYRLDGTKVALVSHEMVNEEVQHYKITGEKGTNYFANGLLNGDRNCPKDIYL